MEKQEADALREKMRELELLVENNEKQKLIAVSFGCPIT